MVILNKIAMLLCMSFEGSIKKLKAQFAEEINYQFVIGDSLINLNERLGKKIKLEFTGQINCIATGLKIKKSYNQGYSYKAFISLAECDMCIMKPELCHYALGTCRQPKWGEEHCMIDHFVYLANTSGLKVGITRHTQIPTRWIDQGATQAIKLVKVKDRYTSGLIETELAKVIKDKTDFRKMLKSSGDDLDLLSLKEQLIEQFSNLLAEHNAQVESNRVYELNYPILKYPDKINSLSFDKTQIVEGILQGIKGQYLIFDHGVLNIRKHQGYYLKVS